MPLAVPSLAVTSAVSSLAVSSPVLTSGLGYGLHGFTGTQIVLLAVAALLVGFAKTAVGGVASISVVLFATVLPARESTGALLPLLILGDVFAVTAYREHAHWRTLLRMLPAVVVGVVVGALFVSRVDDLVMRRTIGVVLVMLVAVNLWTRARQSGWWSGPAAPGPPRGSPAQGSSAQGSSAQGSSGHRSSGHRSSAHGSGALARRLRVGGYGSLVGFTTMVANAGGPVMSLYMLSMRMQMLAFLGTGAWLFAMANLVKVPFSVGLGLISTRSLVTDAVLAPAVVAGALLGRRVIRMIDQALFERIVLVVTVLSAVNLVR
jgi:uncharacterized membrane protein YfcA